MARREQTLEATQEFLPRRHPRQQVEMIVHYAKRHHLHAREAFKTAQDLHKGFLLHLTEQHLPTR